MPSVISGDANVSATEFGFLDGVTSALQSQIDSKLPLAGGKILQTVSTTKTDTFTTSSTTYVDVTGLSLSITPASSSNKILVIAYINLGTNAGSIAGRCQLVRTTTAIGNGTLVGSRQPAIAESAVGSGHSDNIAFNHLDSPATTSPVTYKIQVAGTGGGLSIFVNRSYTDTDAGFTSRTSSGLTLMEVSA